jgi:glycosyltransferase involved in cell wall biosynthesis
MALSDITPVILTYNEEPNIGRALEMLSWASRVVVVDSFSSDRTVDIVSTFPQAVLYQRAFDTHAKQWNFGLDQVESSWVLALDADYVLSEPLIGEISDPKFSFREAGYYARFRYCIGGKALRGSLYPPRLLLFRRTKGKYADDGHTQRLQLEGNAGWLTGMVYHDDRKPLSAWLKAQDRYTQLEVVKLRGMDASKLSTIDKIRRRKWLAPFLTPVYCLIAKGLILDGLAGVHYTLQRTYAELLLSLHLLEPQSRVAQKEQ